jgi:quercetin dioxygenase-like cupin family protein
VPIVARFGYGQQLARQVTGDATCRAMGNVSAEDAQWAVADLVAVAVGAVQDVAGPPFEQPRDVGELVAQAGGVVVPASEVEPKPRVHDGHEWIYVLSGHLRLVLDDRDWVLGPGDVAEFDTRVPPWFGSAGDGAAEILSIFGRPGERMTSAPHPGPGPGPGPGAESSAGRSGRDGTQLDPGPGVRSASVVVMIDNWCCPRIAPRLRQITAEHGAGS